ncbi:acyl-CoA N-acyltransferase [Chytriomyces sp. MP71]|nr:acyl-CoA N-acyltransferase [Chytriomyces sp. MP71]
MALFSTTLISPDVINALKEGYKVRPLELGDYDKGFLTTLGSLTTVGPVSKHEFAERFQYIKARNDTYFTIVVEDIKNRKIVAAGSILVERKFVHGCGLVGHIEDIVTSEAARGLNLGRLIIETLKYIGQKTGCYKTHHHKIVDCSEKNIPFYNKCGFTQKASSVYYYLL